MINETRQILMNELGLTRESVRKEMQDIVKSTVETHLNSQYFQLAMDRIIKTCVVEYLKQANYDRDMLKRAVAEGIQKLLMSRIEVSVKTT